MNDTPLVSRRAVLAGAGVGAAVVLGSSTDANAEVQYFRHGVASGDPRPDRVVLWTRVTPTTAARPGSGQGPTVTVSWAIATDPDFADVVTSGQVTTGPAQDHTVKLAARRLEPATDYYYRFAYRGVRSRVGRTRTAPATDAQPDNLRLGLVSCANLQAGWFSVYRHLAGRGDLDAIVHLGDYYYEYGVPARQKPSTIRKHRPGHETVSLTDYRKRHAQYKTDADLQELHARYPFIAVWDDHEVSNNTWKDGADGHDPDEGSFTRRKKAARRAYDEWMPTEIGGTAAVRDGRQLYRSLRFGQLAELSMLDLRSYRSQPVTDVDGPVDDPSRTMTGAGQMGWLKDQIAATRAQWKLIGNPVMIAPVVRPEVPERVDRALDALTGVPRTTARASQPEPFSLAAWSGYGDDQREVIDHIDSSGATDVVFLTGDTHSAWANELPLDASTYPETRSVATEFICTSITSNNLSDRDGLDEMTSAELEAEFKEENPFVKQVDFDHHGYCVVDVTAERTQVDWFVISDRTDPAATSRWQASFATDAGTQTLRSVPNPVV